MVREFHYTIMFKKLSVLNYCSIDIKIIKPVLKWSVKTLIDGSETLLHTVIDLQIG